MKASHGNLDTSEGKPANDNPDGSVKPAVSISFHDLAAGLGISDDELIERIGDVLLAREENDAR